MAAAGEIKAEVGQALFEFLHMETLSYLVELHGKENKVMINLL